METGSNLGKLLLEEKLINSDQLISAHEFQKKNDVKMKNVQLGHVKMHVKNDLQNGSKDVNAEKKKPCVKPV